MVADLDCGDSKKFTLKGDVTGESAQGPDEAKSAGQSAVYAAIGTQIGELLRDHQCKPPCFSMPTVSFVGPPKIAIGTEGTRQEERKIVSYYGTHRKWVRFEPYDVYWYATRYTVTVVLTCVPMPDEGNTKKKGR